MRRRRSFLKLFFLLIIALVWFQEAPVFSQSAPTLDGKIDDVYKSHPATKKDYVGFYASAKATLYVLDDVTIDPTYVWVCWEIHTDFNDNSYNNNKHSSWSSGHIFGDLAESDMQRLDLEDTCGNLVLDVSMDYIESGYATPSGYGTGKDSAEFPIPGANDYIITGNWDHIEFDTSLAYNLNDTGYCVSGDCSGGGTDLLSDSPPWSDEPNYIPSATYSDWIYNLVWELRIDRSVFTTGCPGGTILGVATNPIELHASPSKIGISPVTLIGAESSIGDYVWFDVDRDGVQDVTEEGIANVTIDLYSDPNGDGDPSDGSVIATTTTDAYGRYLFHDLGNGDYVVDVTDTNNVLSGLQRTNGTGTEHDVTDLGYNDEYLDADFGYAPPSTLGAIGDYVWSDADDDGVQDPGEPGIGNVTLDLITAGPDGEFGTVDDVIEATVTTKDDGSYLFTGLAAGDYRVEVTDTNNVLTGYSLSVGPQSSTDPTQTIRLETGDVYLNADFGYYQAGLGSIGNQIWLDEDIDGYFDTGEVGIFNVTVDLIKDTDGDGVWDPGEMVISSITAEDGTYQFVGLSLDDGGGDAAYLVHVSDTKNILRRYRKSTGSSPGTDNYSQADPYAVALSSGTPSNQTADFGYYFDYINGLVGDYVWYDLDGDGIQDDNEAGVEGVELMLERKQGSKWVTEGYTFTDANGYYYFPNLDTGGGGKDYRVTVTSTATTHDDQTGNFAAGGPLYGYSGTNQPDNIDESATLTAAAPEDRSLDFGYEITTTGATYSIGDYVWYDADADGTQDEAPSTFGLENVTVELYEDTNSNGILDDADLLIGSTVTYNDPGQNEYGKYLFSGLPNGDYIVNVTDEYHVLAGYTMTAGTQPWPVTINGADRLDIDFGYYLQSTTLAFVSPFRAYSGGGGTIVHWETASEVGTAGFYLLRRDNPDGRYRRVNGEFLPGLLHAPQGGIYRFVDRTAQYGQTYTYKLVEVESSGNKRIHGPFAVTVGADPGPMDSPDPERVFPLEPMRGIYSKAPHRVSPSQQARLRAGKLALEMETAGIQQKSKKKGQVKIALKEKGLYYLAVTEIADAAGLSPHNIKAMIKNQGLRLLNRGREIAWLPARGNGGIYFYGEGIDNDIYTDRNIYQLTKGKGLRIESLYGGMPTAGNGDETFVDTIHIEKEYYAPTALFDNPGADFWLWDYLTGGQGGKIFKIYAPGAASWGSATLTVHLKGATDTTVNPDHHVQVSLNGSPIGTSRWNGTESHQLNIPISQSLLLDGENTVEVTAVLDSGVPYSIFYVDSFDLEYNRHYRAVQDSLLCRGDGNPVITVEGFTDPDMRVFDVSDPTSPKLLSGAVVEQGRVSFVPATPQSVYLVLSAAGLRSPLSVTADKPSRLKRTQNSADYLVIAPEGLTGAAEDLASLRQRRGMEAKVVELEDIYDEFNHGISSPAAIKEFLSYAYRNWRGGPPRYVVLAGDGTYDYKDNLGHGDNLVPPILVNTPQGLFASDNHFGDVEGDDGIPEIAVGRLPVLTAAELRAFIDKISDYENADPYAGWTGRVMMLADDPDEGGDFPSDSDYLAGLIPGTYTVDKVYLPHFPNIDEARLKLWDGINNGVFLVNYIGHAGLYHLAHEKLLRVNDVSVFQNGEMLPMVTAMTCVVGRFAIPGHETLSEALILKEDGGAAAVWAPTGASLNDLARMLADGFFRTVFQGGEKTLGEALLKAMQDYALSGGQRFMLDIYTLLGDPAMEIK